MSRAGKVFISHTHEDNDRCRPLLAALDAWSVDYWFDMEDMTAGQDLAVRIQDAIMESDIFVRVCTAATNQSFWMGLETKTFLGLQAEDHRTVRTTKRLLINLILDPGYHFRSFVSLANTSISYHLVPGCCLLSPAASAILCGGWRRQDVLGSKALCTLTTETVRGVSLAHRSQRVKSFELSSPLVRDVPARKGEGITHRLVVVQPPAQLSRQRAQVNG